MCENAAVEALSDERVLPASEQAAFTISQGLVSRL